MPHKKDAHVLTKKHRMKRWARITASKTSMIKKISN